MPFTWSQSAKSLFCIRLYDNFFCFSACYSASSVIHWILLLYLIRRWLVRLFLFFPLSLFTFDDPASQFLRMSENARFFSLSLSLIQLLCFVPIRDTFTQTFLKMAHISLSVYSFIRSYIVLFHCTTKLTMEKTWWMHTSHIARTTLPSGIVVCRYTMAFGW